VIRALEYVRVSLADLWHWLAQDAEYLLRYSRNRAMIRILEVKPKERS
jgi:hypothetical protein